MSWTRADKLQPIPTCQRDDGWDFITGGLYNAVNISATGSKDDEKQIGILHCREYQHR